MPNDVSGCQVGLKSASSWSTSCCSNGSTCNRRPACPCSSSLRAIHQSVHPGEKGQARQIRQKKPEVHAGRVHKQSSMCVSVEQVRGYLESSAVPPISSSSSTVSVWPAWVRARGRGSLDVLSSAFKGGFPPSPSYQHSTLRRQTAHGHLPGHVIECQHTPRKPLLLTHSYSSSANAPDPRRVPYTRPPASPDSARRYRYLPKDS